jgi:predicted nucleotidyltransferase
MKFGLRNSDIIKIRGVFSQFSDINEVILYGSRAMGNYRKGSDIDFTIKGNLKDRDFYDILHQLDDLMLPYMIDVSRFESIDNENLIDHINRRGQVFYEREKVAQ